jgi:hypothetical protein
MKELVFKYFNVAYLRYFNIFSAMFSTEGSEMARNLNGAGKSFSRGW